MARSSRIDNPSIDAQGNITIRYTIAKGALPAAKGKMGYQFPNRTALIAWISELEDTLTDEQMARLATLLWYRADPTLTNIASGDGRTCAINLLAGARPINFT